MQTKLSIIIPCYNSEKTLKEAVDSCYRQDLTANDFEIIMVDDGSCDSTRKVIESLAAQHENISLLFHEVNKGGGAARNTGIKAAKNEIIFCLDSDNFFSPQSVKPVLNFLIENNLEGVAFHERRFFVGSNTRKFSSHINTIQDRNIRLFDILNGSGTLLDNFFFTKAAYNRTSGYPEHHGFDTQCFEVRFLSVGNTVGVCPNSMFWHRQAGGKKSYFERVYESGEFSLNMYYIMEDVIHLLSPQARRFIFAFDIFGKTKLGKENLLTGIITTFGNDESLLFQPNYKQYLHKDGLTKYVQTEGKTDEITNAVYSYLKGEYVAASSLFLSCLIKNGPNQIIYYNAIRCAVGASGVEKNKIEKFALKTSQSFILTKQKIDLNPNILKRFIYKIYHRLQ